MADVGSRPYLAALIASVSACRITAGFSLNTPEHVLEEELACMRLRVLLSREHGPFVEEYTETEMLDALEKKYEFCSTLRVGPQVKPDRVCPNASCR